VRLNTDSPEEAARAVAGDSIIIICDPARATLVELLPKATRQAPKPLTPLPAPQVKSTITADYLYHTVAKLRPKNSVIAQESLPLNGRDVASEIQ
jgi:benzoylformate decarboxylase